MRRYGPLIAGERRLLLGDPGRAHLSLSADGLTHRDGVEQRLSFGWQQLSLLALDLPTTRFRFPGLVGTVGLGLVAAAVQDDLGIGPDDIGAVDVVIDGEPRRLPLGRHHVGGYWVRSVIGAQRLLDHLLAHPAQRALLEQPRVLIDLAAKLARQDAG